MATQKQVFTEITESIDRCNHTLPGLIQFLKNGFQKLENASGGGGGGSEVSWTQIQATGTKIAEIEIDGDKTSVYAPTEASGSVSVTADGVKTYSALFDELFALIDLNKISNKSYLTISDDNTIAHIGYNASNRDDFVGDTLNYRYAYTVKNSGSQFNYYDFTTSTYTDASSVIPTAGVIITIHY